MNQSKRDLRGAARALNMNSSLARISYAHSCEDYYNSSFCPVPIIHGVCSRARNYDEDLDSDSSDSDSNGV